jgi:hypothetical protein
MDKFSIEIEKDSALIRFEIIDYAHHEEENRCKFEVLKESKFIASFEPDSKGFLHICKNTGEVDEELLHLIADKLEMMNI